MDTIEASTGRGARAFGVSSDRRAAGVVVNVVIKCSFGVRAFDSTHWILVGQEWSDGSCEEPTAYHAAEFATVPE